MSKQAEKITIRCKCCGRTSDDSTVVRELVTALEQMRLACDEWAAEFMQHKRAMKWDVVNGAYVAASKALCRAKDRLRSS